MQSKSIASLLTRRSVVAKDLTEPGPSKEELDEILRCGHRVPDHGKIGPWRFILFAGEARKHFGEKLAEIFINKAPGSTERAVHIERDRFLRAPMVLAVVSSPVEHPKVPLWEQQLSVGAVCQNILNAAHCTGYGAQWLTEWYAFDPQVSQLLGLSETEKVAGFIYIGSFEQRPSERSRPNLKERVSSWST